MSVVHSGIDQKRYQVIAGEAIPKGTFVSQYLGEVLTPDEARDRLLPSYEGKNNYILCLAENFDQGVMLTCIDAAEFGNVSRFMNHSCDANLEIKLVRTNIVIPRACLFARRDIAAGEELCYNYGTEYTEELTLGPPCHCGSSNCIGFLPVSRIATG
uniref:SET domain-containing protein n=1 Tax=Panagrellus redivivus TaxID=6233 RepID=A0A7E4V670_PANRE